MRTKLPIITLLAASGFAGAATINIAFHVGPGTIAGMTSQGAGTVVDTTSETWNNVQGAQFTSSNFSNVGLSLGDGNSSGASLSGSVGYAEFTSNGWQSGENQDWVMMESWFGMRNSENITIANLPAAFTSNGYIVTVYGEINGSRDMDYVLNDGTSSQTLNINDTVAKFTGTFIEGTNYDTSSVMSGDTLVITGNTTKSGRSAITGIVITSVPEPSAALLGGLGLLTLLRRRR